MVIAKLQGGLGNQMFQYAAGLSLARKRQTNLKLDISFLLDRAPKENFVLRDFDLEVFDVPESVATPEEVRSFTRLTEPGTRSLLERLEDKMIRRSYFREENGPFDCRVLDLSRRTYLDGYFQNEKYFEDIGAIIRQCFKFPEHQWELTPEGAALMDAITSSNSVCLNVRRGDYVTNPASHYWHGVCEKDYFLKAMTCLAEKVESPHYYVFSDDPAWCRESFSGMPNLTVVGHEHKGPRFVQYLWMMSQCKHFIIPNSSFAWWAAWLAKNPEKLILRPSVWFRAPEMKGVNICPESWIAVDNA